MATITLTQPTAYGSGQLDEPETLSLPSVTTNAANGTNIVTGDITYVDAAGKFHDTQTNATSFAGIATHDAAAIYFNANSGQPLAKTGLFGSTQTGTSLQPNWDASQLKCILLRNNQMLNIALLQTWAIADVGTTAGIGIDSTTKYYLLDNSQSNKPFTIVGTVDGPSVFGTVGDVNKRVLATCLPANLVI